jgi:hypothetical protein
MPFFANPARDITLALSEVAVDDPELAERAQKLLAEAIQLQNTLKKVSKIPRLCLPLG